MNFKSFFEVTYLYQVYNDKFENTQTKGIDKLDGRNFKNDAFGKIAIASRKILDGDFEFSPYLELLKLKGRNKIPRVISIPTVRDRIVLFALKETLHNFFEEKVNRKKPNAYIREIKDYVSENENSAFLKLDIEKFYDRINRDILIRILEEKELDSRLINLIKKAINNPTVPLNTSRNQYSSFETELGVPQGLSISNILAQIYLGELDDALEKRKYFYRRYVDDIVILSATHISDFRYRNIEIALDNLKLSLNHRKTAKGSLKTGFNFLSYKIKENKVSVAEKNIESFIRRIAGKFTWYRARIKNHELRPNWLQDQERFKTVFIEELNETITGIVSSKKNYGWLFYFSEMNDLSLLFKLDKIISSFFESLPSFDHEAPSELKKLVRAWHSIVHNDYTYLSNYDEIDTVRKKRGLFS